MQCEHSVIFGLEFTNVRCCIKNNNWAEVLPNLVSFLALNGSYSISIVLNSNGIDAEMRLSYKRRYNSLMDLRCLLLRQRPINLQFAQFLNVRL